MTDWLLDTNVVSEPARPHPDGRVLAFLSSLKRAYLSAVTIYELDYGMRRAAGQRRRTELGAWFAALESEYADRILPVERGTAKEAARLCAEAADEGRTVGLADALIAGTAVRHQMTIATRNTRDFDDCGVASFNPWSG